MKTLKHLSIILLLVLSLTFVLAEVPTLTNFAQFYGTVEELPAGSFMVVAQVGGASHETAVGADSRYGYESIFKFTASEGAQITFVLQDDFSGNETVLGNAIYRDGAVTSLNFVYGEELAEVEAVVVDDVDAADGGAVADADDVVDVDVVNESADVCEQTWECETWSSCRSGFERRSCERADTCDSQLLVNEDIELIFTSKPSERRVCDEGDEREVVEQTCSPRTKRCSSDILERCSLDGSEWQTLEVCDVVCDAASLRCVAPKVAAGDDEGGLPSWVLPLVGSIVLLIIIGALVVVIVNRRKYAPARNYIAQSRKRGATNEQIKSRLVAQGWKRAKVDNLLKK
jgi:uncharacterized integral membrane protein